MLRSSGTGNSLDQITEQEDSEDLEGGELDDALEFNLKKNSVSDVSAVSRTGSYFTLNIPKWIKGEKKKEKKKIKKRRLVS